MSKDSPFTSQKYEDLFSDLKKNMLLEDLIAMFEDMLSDCNDFFLNGVYIASKMKMAETQDQIMKERDYLIHELGKKEFCENIIQMFKNEDLKIKEKVHGNKRIDR